VSGLPKSVEVSSEEIRGALKEPLAYILDAIKMTLDQTPPELAGDIMDRGIFMVGGGSLLKGLDKLVSEETGIPVYIADNPLDCVALGTGRALEEIDTLRKVLG
jgi:rod shape-determining protein MreB